MYDVLIPLAARTTPLANAPRSPKEKESESRECSISGNELARDYRRRLATRVTLTAVKRREDRSLVVSLAHESTSCRKSTIDN